MTGTSARTISLKKKVVFAVCLIGFGILAGTLLAEVGIRAAGVTVANDPFVHMGMIESYFDETEVDGVPAYKVAHREVYRERNIVFSKVKAPNTFRVFTFGGSANAGWPHPPAEIYTAYLQEALSRAYPGRRIEVINLGAHAYGAYRVRLIAQQVMPLDPDLIVIYSGNNEFVEQRRYSTEPHWYDPLQRLARASSLYRLIRGSRTLFPDVVDAEERGHVAFEQWSKIEQLVLDLRKDPAQFGALQAHYRHSIGSMIADAADHDVPVFLLTVPVNLRDWQPNVSLQTASGPALEQWEAAYRAGRRALIQGAPEEALRHLTQAAQLDADHAATRFYLARALEGVGDNARAYEMYSLARDLDHNPFRALSVFNEILRDLASANPHVTLLDAAGAMRAAADPPAPGRRHFLDYVHPSSEGNMVLARLVFDAIVEQRLVGGDAAAGDFTTWRDARRAAGGDQYSDAGDHAMQVTLVVLCMMMHQYELALELAEPVARTPEAVASLPEEEARHLQRAYAVLPELVSAERAALVEDTPETDERLRQAHEKLAAYYREAFEGYAAFQEDQAQAAP